MPQAFVLGIGEGSSFWTPKGMCTPSIICTDWTRIPRTAGNPIENFYDQMARSCAHTLTYIHTEFLIFEMEKSNVESTAEIQGNTGFCCSFGPGLALFQKQDSAYKK